MRFRVWGQLAVLAVALVQCAPVDGSSPQGERVAGKSTQLLAPPNPTVGSTPATSGQPATIGVMVLYTSTAEANFRLGAGDPNPASDLAFSEIAQAIEFTNVALANSRAHVALNLVQTACVCSSDAPTTHCAGESDCSSRPTVEIGTSDGETLAKLGSPTAANAQIHQWRDELGADLVMLVAHAGQTSGIAGWPMQYSTAYDFDAFGIVFPGNVMGPNEDRSFAHEVGHLLGGQHDWWQEASRLAIFAEGDPQFSPSVDQLHGAVYIDESEAGTGANDSFYTIMSYANACTAEGVVCRAVPYFSNPDLADAQTEEPLGHVGDRTSPDYFDVCLSSDPTQKKLIDDTTACPTDMVSVFNRMAPYVAAYRSTHGPDGGATDLSVVQEGTRLRLDWTDTTTNELGFRIYRSTDEGLNWNFIDSVAADVTTYTDPIRTAFDVGFTSKWQYRVEAYNAGGMTTFAQAEIAIHTGCNSVDYDFEPTSGTSCPSLSAIAGDWSNDPSHPWSVAQNPATGGSCALASFVPPGGVSGTSSLTLNGAHQEGFVCFDIWSPWQLLQFEQIGGWQIEGSAWSYGPTRVAVPLSSGATALRWDVLFNEFDANARVYVDNIDLPPAACPDGTFATPGAGCVPCDASCTTCTGPGFADCGACAAGYWDDGGTCVKCRICAQGEVEIAACTPSSDTQCSTATDAGSGGAGGAAGGGAGGAIAGGAGGAAAGGAGGTAAGSGGAAAGGAGGAAAGAGGAVAVGAGGAAGAGTGEAAAGGAATGASGATSGSQDADIAAPGGGASAHRAGAAGQAGGCTLSRSPAEPDGPWVLVGLLLLGYRLLRRSAKGEGLGG